MLTRLPQGQLHGALALDPIAHAYACIGLYQQPDALANVWRNARGDIEGALIDCEWSSFQLIATTREAVHALLDCLPTLPWAGWRLSFPEWAMREVAARWPKAERSYEVLHVCLTDTYRSPNAIDAEIVRLTPQLVERYAFDLEVVKALSGLSAQQFRHPLYGALVDNQLVSIADGTAMSEQVAIVQQVYTVPAYRHRGLGRAVVARLTEDILALGRISAYCADYANHHSLALCRSLGYQPIAVFGTAEYDPS